VLWCIGREKKEEGRRKQFELKKKKEVLVVAILVSHPVNLFWFVLRKVGLEEEEEEGKKKQINSK